MVFAKSWPSAHYRHFLQKNKSKRNEESGEISPTDGRPLQGAAEPIYHAMWASRWMSGSRA